jgi:CcmD family protein
MWGYVFMAYGIVWGTILFYFISLKRRCRAAETELQRLSAEKGSHQNATP